MIELAAAVWQVTIPEAVTRLAYEGIPIPDTSLTDEAILGYVAGRLVRRNDFNVMWAKAQQFLLHHKSTTIARLRHKLSLSDAFSRERALAGPAQLFGALPVKAVEKAFLPDAVPHSSARRVFMGKGRGWDDVLVIPYHSAPGQISAFYFVGRTGRLEDRVMRPICNGRNTRSHAEHEAGLAGLETALNLPSSFVIGVSDPLLMLRMQMKNFNTSKKALPLVAWHTSLRGDTQKTWNVLHGRRIILWETVVTAQLIIQCVRVNGHLCLVGPRTPGARALDHYLRSYQMGDLVRKITAEAKPWRETLAHWLRTADPTVVLRVIHRLRSAGQDPYAIFGECVPARELRERHGMEEIQETQLGARSFVARGNRWFVRLKGVEKLFCNGVVRVDRIVTRGRKSEYQGNIRMDQGTIPFRLPTRKDPNATDQKRLSRLALEAGHRLYFDKPGINPFSLAMAFHEPPIVKGHSRIGWDGKAFRFRHFSVTGGQLRTHDETLFPESTPGPQQEVLRINAPVLAALNQPSVEAEVCWATILSLLSCVLSHATGQDGRGVLVTGLKLESLSSELLGRLGVPSKVMLRGPRTKWAEISPVPWNHAWPLSLKRAGHVTWESSQKWLVSSGFPWGVCAESEIRCWSTVLHGNYVLVRCHENLSPTTMSHFPAEQVCLGYLRHWTAKSAEERSSARTWQALQDDVARWLATLGTDDKSVRACSRWMVFPEEPDLLQRFIALLYRAGTIGIKDSRYEAVQVDFDARGLVVTREQLRRAFTAARLFAPNFEAYPDSIIVPRTYLE